jgi:uncharacterized phage protein (TIGR01671 family)
MREIKFRLWSKSRQEMIYPKFGWYTKCYIGDNGVLQDIQLGTAIGLNGTKLELMQYTGLKDKNGKEIYEGDIVERNVLAFEEVRTFTGEVIMYEGAWWIDNGSAAVPLWSETHELEVIGNIYENPDLAQKIKSTIDTWDFKVNGF